ncbi:MAG: MarR family transcriptional regulator, partial [Myxococcota bacterium]
APDGTTRGPSVMPLYGSVPEAVAADEQLHRWLALVDSLRVGSARERDSAAKALHKELVP